MPNNAYEIIAGFAVAVALLLFGRIICRSLRNKYAKLKTGKALVTDKFVSDKFTKIYGAAAKKPQYYVVFEMDGKKMSFRVSEFSYAGYKVGERGTLKYKGDKLVDFS